MIKATHRLVLCLGVLATGVAGQEVLERTSPTERPELQTRLATVPLSLGDWVGEDVPVDPHILSESQADDWLNRSYENQAHPGWKLMLWINYSKNGLNLRHSPEICLPSGGWIKTESQSKVFEVPQPSRAPLHLTRLVYAQGEVSQSIGFWYYIFGEGSLEQFVRGLPITSRSSHGRTTRGSGMTVEIFSPGETDPESESLRSFAPLLLDALDQVLPSTRAEYFIP